MHLKTNCPKNSKMALKFSKAKQSKVMDHNIVLIGKSRTIWLSLI